MKYFNSLLALSASAAGTYAQVIATNPMGATNPATPSLNTPVNQNSQARLLSVNSAEDFCLFAGFGSGEPIGNIEGYGDLTKIGIVDGDFGGELDPHGAYGLGNPVGGNVTSNISGKDQSYEEWMEFVGYNSFCLRVCTANAPYPASLMCEHELDVMGCDFVMPAAHNPNVFQNCESEDALPPGLYIQPDGSTSTFRQYFAGEYTANGNVIGYAVGQTVTPAAAQFTPASSNCVAVPSISNGMSNLAIATSSVSDESSVSRASSVSGSSSGTNTASLPANTGSVTSKATGTGTSSGLSRSSSSTSSARSTGTSTVTNSSTPSSARAQYVSASWAVLLVLAVAPIAILAATY